MSNQSTRTTDVIMHLSQVIRSSVLKYAMHRDGPFQLKTYMKGKIQILQATVGRNIEQQYFTPNILAQKKKIA